MKFLKYRPEVYLILVSTFAVFVLQIVAKLIDSEATVVGPGFLEDPAIKAFRYFAGLLVVMITVGRLFRTMYQTLTVDFELDVKTQNPDDPKWLSTFQRYVLLLWVFTALILLYALV